MSPLRSNSRGFTLIEVLAALVIMMIGLLGLLQAVMVSLEYDTKNVLREESVRLAEEQMHDFRAKAAAYDTDALFRTTFHTATTASLQIRGGRRDFTVIKEYQETGSKSRRLWVKVSWKYKGADWQHEISTVKSYR